MMKQKTVLFGPFIGEFFWEMLWWQGWVRRACRTVYKDYHKVVASFPGRYPFYPDADEFWVHPREILGDKIVSARNYYNTNWFAGMTERRDRFEEYTDNVWEGSELVRQLTEHYRKQLPDDALILAPSNWIDIPELPPAFGVKIEKHSDGTFSAKEKRIDARDQILEPLYPTEGGKAFLRKLVPEDRKLVTIFPRARRTNRPDKNWPVENYGELITWLQKRYPRFTIALVGDTEGAYFADGAPPGCINLVSIDPDIRTDVHIAALRQSRLCLGPSSGAFGLAFLTRCPSLMWGYREHRQKYWYSRSHNYFRTMLIYIAEMQPTVSEVRENITFTLSIIPIFRNLKYGYFQWIEPALLRTLHGTTEFIGRTAAPVRNLRKKGTMPKDANN